MRDLSLFRWQEPFHAAKESIKALLAAVDGICYVYRAYTGKPAIFSLNGENVTRDSRLWIQALSQERADGSQLTVNLTFSLDHTTPAYSYSAGWINREGLLVVPRETCVLTGELLEGIPSIESIRALSKQVCSISEWHEELCVPITDRKAYLGGLLDDVLTTRYVISGQKVIMLGQREALAAYSSVFHLDCPEGRAAMQSTPTYLDYYRVIASLIQGGELCAMPAKLMLASELIRKQINKQQDSVPTDILQSPTLIGGNGGARLSGPFIQKQ